ncbi:MAG: hypothetical protein AAFP22_02655 [Planctomycetota bacterium]
MTTSTNEMNWKCGLTAATAALAAACGGGSGGGNTVAPPSIGALTGTSQLARVALDDAATSLRTGKGPLGHADVRAIARDAATGTVYGIDQNPSAGDAVLLRVDAAAGPRGLRAAPTIIGPFGDSGAPLTLVWHAGERVLYGVSAPSSIFQSGRLMRIDPATGESVVVGECAKVTSLAHDPVSGALHGVRGDGFWRIDPATGASTLLFTEPALLPDVTSLAYDAATGTFLAGAFDPVSSDAPRMLRVDLFGSVDVLGAVDEVLVDLESPGPGGFLGLGDGGSLVDVEPDAQAFTVSHRGNLGLELFDLTNGAPNGGYFGIDATGHLVRFHLDGSSRTIGRVAIPTRQLVLDRASGELWGFGATTLTTSTDLDVYRIDTATAEITTAPVRAQVSSGTRFAYDDAAGVIRAISAVNNVTLTLDTATGATTLTANAHGLDDVVGLTFDPGTGRLIALTTGNPGAPVELRAWEPATSGQSTRLAMVRSWGYGLARGASAGRYLSISGDDLVEFDAPGDGGNASLADNAAATYESVRDANYRATTYVDSIERVFALSGGDVFSIDPATGATALVGGTPGSGLVTSVVWDSERGEPGYLASDEIRWTSVSAPWLSPRQTSLGGRNLDYVAFSPDRGVFYLVGPDGLFSMARNGNSASFVEVSADAPPVTVRDIAWRDGAIWASTDERALYRVDPDSGSWTRVGTTALELVGLY